jgi:phosphoglycolate phosphatase-like HAD superfamily hydrolase
LLLLFDIDGTLMRGATAEHREAIRHALRAVHSVEAPITGGSLSVAGKTDGEIARAALLAAGVSAERIDERENAVREACAEAYARLCPPDLSSAVVPGVPALLEWLSEREGCQLALLTGNYEAVARLKLARAGIGHYFPPHQGAFGSDGEDRAALPAIARRRAGSPGHRYPRDQTIVIGDTPRDIACARADMLRCVTVAAGPYGIDELREADAVVADIEALRTMLAELVP